MVGQARKDAEQPHVAQAETGVIGTAHPPVKQADQQDDAHAHDPAAGGPQHRQLFLLALVEREEGQVAVTDHLDATFHRIFDDQLINSRARLLQLCLELHGLLLKSLNLEVPAPQILGLRLDRGEQLLQLARLTLELVDLILHRRPRVARHVSGAPCQPLVIERFGRRRDPLFDARQADLERDDLLVCVAETQSSHDGQVILEPVTLIHEGPHQRISDRNLVDG